MEFRKTVIAVLVGAALGIGSTLGAAQAGGYGHGPYGMGAGMMGGWGGHGMGPGMMGGWGGYGMGPGMMGGWGGYGTGPGMMYGCGYGVGSALDLTDDQRSKIGKIQDELHTKQGDLMGKLREQFARRAEAPDDASAGKADDQIAVLQQQMIANAAGARKQMDAVLTKEQRQQLRRGGY